MMELTLSNEFHNTDVYSITRSTKEATHHEIHPIVKLLHEVKNNEEDTIF